MTDWDLHKDGWIIPTGIRIKVDPYIMVEVV